jgi:hypothetical protein
MGDGLALSEQMGRHVWPQFVRHPREPCLDPAGTQFAVCGFLDRQPNCNWPSTVGKASAALCVLREARAALPLLRNWGGSPWRPRHWLPLRDSNSGPRFFLTSATYKRREDSEPGLYRNPINASDSPPRHFRPSGRRGEGFVILVSREKPCSGPTIPARDPSWIKGGINDSKSVANMASDRASLGPSPLSGLEIDQPSVPSSAAASLRSAVSKPSGNPLRTGASCDFASSGWF